MQTFNLDLSIKKIVPLLYAKQRDVGAKICIVLTDNQETYPIPNDAQFSVWFSGKSGSGNYTEIDGKSAFEIEGNTVTVELIYQMLNNPGEHMMCLVMNGADGKQQGLWNIPYFVEAIPGADSEAATAYYNAFLDAQKKAEEAAERAEAAADRAESAGGGGGTIIVALDEGNVATHTALEIYNAIQNNHSVVFREDLAGESEFIPLKSSAPYWAVFSKRGYPTEFDIFNIQIDARGDVSYKTSFGSDLVDLAVEKVETDIAPVSYLPQTLTEEQKAQARANIGASTVEDVLAALPNGDEVSY